MKLLILEGGDALGKNSLIEGICKYFNYDNVCVRHFGKPPKRMTPKEVLDFQFKCFRNEAELFHDIKRRYEYSKYHYFEEIMIWNRSHLGEYVYSQMFRGGDSKELKDKLLHFEKVHLGIYDEIYLVTLTAEPEFFLSKEDGNSFSQTLEEKTKELELFKEIHEISLIKNKLLLKVDFLSPNVHFRSKEEILNDVIKLINKNYEKNMNKKETKLADIILTKNNYKLILDLLINNGFSSEHFSCYADVFKELNETFDKNTHNITSLFIFISIKPEIKKFSFYTRFINDEKPKDIVNIVNGEINEETKV
jgi:hypothetical protein